MARVRVEVDGYLARVYSPYDPERVEIIKTIPGRRWDSRGKFWEIPAVQVPNLVVALGAFGDVVAINQASEPPPQQHKRDDGEVRQLREENRRLEREKQRLEQAVVRMRNEADAADDRSWAEQLLSGCDPQLSEKVFKRLVTVLHPDAGGDTRLMQELNVARDLLDAARTYR